MDAARPSQDKHCDHKHNNRNNNNNNQRSPLKQTNGANKRVDTNFTKKSRSRQPSTDSNGGPGNISNSQSRSRLLRKGYGHKGGSGSQDLEKRLIKSSIEKKQSSKGKKSRQSSIESNGGNLFFEKNLMIPVSKDEASCNNTVLGLNEISKNKIIISENDSKISYKKDEVTLLRVNKKKYREVGSKTDHGQHEERVRSKTPVRRDCLKKQLITAKIENFDDVIKNLKKASIRRCTPEVMMLCRQQNNVLDVKHY